MQTVGHRLGEPGGSGCEVAGLEITIRNGTGEAVTGELLDAGTEASELELLRSVGHSLGAG